MTARVPFALRELGRRINSLQQAGGRWTWPRRSPGSRIRRRPGSPATWSASAARACSRLTCQPASTTTRRTRLALRRTVKATISKAAYTPDADGLTLELPHVQADQDQWRSTGGHRVRPRPHAAATYPHILAFPLHLDLMSDPSFPYKPMGIVHLSNTITQHAPIPVTPTLRSRCTASGAAAPEGHALRHPERGPSGRRAGLDQLHDPPQPRRRDAGRARDCSRTRPRTSASWDLHGNLGRRYAAVSGDRNPITFFKLSARPSASPGQIAHGSGRRQPPGLHRTDHGLRTRSRPVEFRKPLTLPSWCGSAAPGGPAVSSTSPCTTKAGP
jgi:hypothetical protein